MVLANMGISYCFRFFFSHLLCKKSSHNGVQWPSTSGRGEVRLCWKCRAGKCWKKCTCKPDCLIPVLNFLPLFPHKNNFSNIQFRVPHFQSIPQTSHLHCFWWRDNTDNGQYLTIDLKIRHAIITVFWLASMKLWALSIKVKRKVSNWLATR